MQVHEWEEYLEQVTNHVRFKYDHPDIRLELRAHLEDRTEDFLLEGCSLEEAQHQALLVMGDAKEVGEALDREHSPLLGWLWRLIHWAVIAMLVLLIPSMLNTTLHTVYSAVQIVRGYQGFDYDRGEEYGELVSVVRSDARGKVDDVHIATES